jgi:plasma-membrane calcium-translocating P-type ATPase
MTNETGLSEKQVKKQREKHGSNEISKTKTNSFTKLFIQSLGDPIIKILLIALAIKVIFLIKDFDWYETIGIVIAILLASFISSISEYGSEKAFEKLQEDASKMMCKVKRNNKIIEILIDEVVKDDIVVLETGDYIPADGYLIDGEISVDESTLNGEAKEAHKYPVKDNIVDNNKVYRGTTVYSKRAFVKITEVGNETVYGKMNLELSNVSPTSPLKLRLSKLAMLISRIGYIGATLVASSYLFKVIVINNGFDIAKITETITNSSLMFGYLLYALTLTVTIIVVAVPEGLPMMITLVLSSNMKRMLKNNVLVRKMVGIETAGNINILFTDKTGTLTKGKLEVTEISLGNMKKFHSESEIMVHHKLHEIISTSIIYNNDSTYSDSKIIGGNITDRALLEFVKNTPKKNIQIIKKVPFDSKQKYSSTVINNGTKKTLIKGAMEKILPKCKYYYNELGEKKPLINNKEIENYITSMSNKGVRILCVAVSESYYGELNNLSLVCIVCIKDDIRKETIKGVNLVKDAGISTVMLTGDNKNTAVAIAKEASIITNDNDIVLTSDDLNKLSDEELGQILPNLKVVARSLPSDKTKLIKIAQSLNLVVGMTGDGVNDAPALKNADVGFSMGSGTEVAKEASDIVILDDNFLSISKAILYGRTIFKSIRKFIICQLTINFCAIGLSFIGPFIGIDTPVTVIQMLWINMVMDTLTGLAFAFEPPLLEYMKEKPKNKKENIINKYMFSQILFTGLYSCLLCFLFLKLPIIKDIYRNNPKYLMSAFFGLFIFIDIFNSFNARTHRLNLFANILKNKIFLFIVCFIVVVQIGLIYFGGELFRTVGLTFFELQFMILLASTVIPLDFIRKIILKRNGKITGV